MGNIGKSWARILSERSRPADYQVVEVSSFQLDGVNSFRLDAAVLLNITPDHLDRYNDIEQYADSAAHCFYQTDSDLLVLNADDPLSMVRWKRAAAARCRPRGRADRADQSQLQNNPLHTASIQGTASVDTLDQPTEFTINIPHQNHLHDHQELALRANTTCATAWQPASLPAHSNRKEGIRDSLAL